MLKLQFGLIVGFNHSFHKYFLSAYYYKTTCPAIRKAKDDWTILAFYMHKILSPPQDAHGNYLQKKGVTGVQVKKKLIPL
jgi:hypothetical protein